MINLIHLQNVPIYKQLQLEEALLRNSSESYCIINEGSPPAIVMGISGKMDELIHVDKASNMQVPIIKRFSGGGTVVVDENTLFVTFLFQKEKHDLHYPEPIYRWSEDFYQKALNHSLFALKENDYVLENKKCGGNAQYLRKNNWLHHTTFLWDYSRKHMELLKHPKKAPKYREQRKHDEFLVKLKDYFPTLQEVTSKLIGEIKKRYHVKEISYELASIHMEKEHRKATKLL